MTQNPGLSQLPTGWLWTSLGEIGTVKAGGTPSTSNSDNFGGEIPWITPADLTGYTRKFIGKGRKSLSEKGLKSSSAILLPKGTVLFSSRAPIGYVAIAENPVSTNQGFKNLIPFDFVFNEYVYYYLKGSKKLAESFGSGTTFKEVSASRFAKIPIPICPMSEQARIVGKVEELFSFLDAGTESLRKVQAQLKRYRQAVLKHAFEGKLTEEWRKTHKDNEEPAEKIVKDIKREHAVKTRRGGKGSSDLPDLPETWAWTKIGELSTFIGSGITPHGGKRVYVGEGVPFIRSQNVHADGLHLANVAYVTPVMHEEMRRTHACPNDVLLNITGASIGRSAYIPEELPEANVNQHVCIIRTGGRVVPAYLSQFLNSTYGQNQIFSTQSGVTRQGLNYVQLRNLQIPFAPLSEQKAIVKIIHAICTIANETENAIKHNMRMSVRLQQSILKDAFEGKLVPQDPADEPAEKLLEHIKAERANNNRYKSDRQMEKLGYVK